MTTVTVRHLREEYVNVDVEDDFDVHNDADVQIAVEKAEAASSAWNQDIVSVQITTDNETVEVW